MGVVLRKLYVWAVILMVLIAGCARGNAEPVVRVGTNPSFAPASYKNDKRELTGFEHDAFEEIGKRMGRKVEWVEIGSLDNLFGSLDAGKIDTIAFQISINEARKKNYIFSDVYGYNKIYLMVREDFKYDTLDDLQGYAVEIEPTHSFYPILMEYNNALPKERQIKVIPSGAGSLFDAIEQGKADAGPITDMAFKARLEKKPYKLKIAGHPVVLEKNAYPFSKNADPELIRAVNDAIASMLQDGTLKRISEQYYKVDVTRPE